MPYKYLLSLLGMTLIALGSSSGTWMVPVAWMGGDFLLLGVAHAMGAHRIIGKRADGSLAWWGWLLFLPLLALTAVVWRLTCLLSREPAYNALTEDLVVGRRLLPSELPREFDNYIDLTAEFAEPRAIRRKPGYVSVSILDGGAVNPEDLRDAVAGLRPGTTFIHCAQGHGRTGMFALAVLISNGTAKSVEEGLHILQANRPGIRLNRAQRQCIERIAAQVCQLGSR